MTQTENDMQRLERWLQMLVECAKIPVDVAETMIITHQKDFKEDRSLTALLKHIEKGGKIQTVEISSENSVSFKSMLQANHLTFNENVITKENGEISHLFLFRDIDKPRMNQIKQEFEIKLSKNAQELDMYTFKSVTQGTEIGIAEKLSDAELYAFRINVKDSSLKYSVVSEADGIKIYADKPEIFNEVMLKTAYDISSDKDGKFRDAVNVYKNQKNKLFEQLDSKKEFVIVDAKNPSNFIHCKGGNFSIHSFKIDEFRTLKDGISPKIYSNNEREKFLSTVKGFSQPVIMSFNEFSLCDSVDKNGKAFALNTIVDENGNKKDAKLDTFNFEYVKMVDRLANEESVLGKIPTINDDKSKEKLEGKINLNPVVTASLERAFEAGIILTSADKKEIAFPKEYKEKIDEWLNVNYFEKIENQLTAKFLDLSTKGKMGDINPVNPGDFYLLDADNPKRVIEIKENIATVYQNGIPTDEKYNVMSNEYQKMMINQLNNIANPVMLSRDEFVGKDKLKIINEKANGLMLDNVLDKFANKAEHSKKELIEQFNNPDFKFTGTAKDAVEFMEKHKISRHQMNNSMLTELQNIKARCNRRERNMQSVEL